jgi:carboxylesterase type B
MQPVPSWQIAGISSPGFNSSSYIANFNLESSHGCLLFNFITPETPKNDSLPVVVMIHGGDSLESSCHQL